MTVFYILFSVSVSFLTACTALLFYLKMPSGWLCEPGEIPRAEHLPENRCPHRTTSIILIAAATELSFLVSGRIIQVPAPEFRELLFLSVSAVVLFPAALSDIDHCVIPDQTCLITLLLALLHRLTSTGCAGLGALISGGILCGGMMLLASFLGYIISRKESVGMGDVKLLAASGALVSSEADPGIWVTAACSVYIITILSSAIWFSALLVSRRAHYGEARPLGPWIVLSTLLMTALW